MPSSMSSKSSRSSRYADDDGSSAEPPDRSVWLHFASYRDGISWPIADYEEKGFFTAAQKDELMSRFDLSPDLVSKLSLYVGNTLDIDSLMNLTCVSRNKSVEKAETALRRSVRHARKNPKYRGKLVEVLLACDALFAETPADAAVLHKAQSLAGTPECCLADLLGAVGLVLAHPGSAAILEPADSRKIRDGRRDHIVRSCCYIWRDAERPLTYTTRPGRLSHERRGGPLFELIRDVMKMVIPDGKRPSDETIRKDIDGFLDLIERHPEVLDGQ